MSPAPAAPRWTPTRWTATSPSSRTTAWTPARPTGATWARAHLRRCGARLTVRSTPGDASRRVQAPRSWAASRWPRRRSATPSTCCIRPGAGCACASRTSRGTRGRGRWSRRWCPQPTVRVNKALHACGAASGLNLCCAVLCCAGDAARCHVQCSARPPHPHPIPTPTHLHHPLPYPHTHHTHNRHHHPPSSPAQSPAPADADTAAYAIFVKTACDTWAGTSGGVKAYLEDGR